MSQTHPRPNASAIASTTSIDYRVLRTVPTYAQAQEFVDALSDAEFPVEHVRIVGTGLRSVEQVTGRMTNGRAALYGAGTGAWLGLMIGLLFGIFTLGAWLPVVLWSVVLGAVWGLVLGLIGHALTGGKRDFRSIQGFEADAYDLLVEAEYAGMADAKLPAQPAA
ncbi:general stress protein [Kocuria arenosa]|uniref:general stress protein n=1 Tax=Kocuria arenosa TaxID=3071446 RepID=UPI0034D4F3B6